MTSEPLCESKLLLSVFAAFLWLAQSTPAALEVPCTCTFDTAPLAPEWATRANIGGAAGDISTAAQLDTAVQTNRVGLSTRTLVRNDNTAHSLGFYNTNDHRIGTRPTGPAYSVILASLVNFLGSDVHYLTVTYTLGVTHPVPEEVPGQRVYWSPDGAAGNWRPIGGFGGTTTGTNLVSFTLDVGTWYDGDYLYLLWADDNGAVSPGTLYTLDDVTFAPYLFFDPPPTPACGLTAPAPDSAFTAGAPITVTATNAGLITNVQFFVDGGPTLAGSATESPFTATIAGLEAGSHTIYALAFDALGGTVFSTTNTITVTNIPPSVTLVSPTNGNLVKSPATVTYQATPTAGSSGTVSSVAFYIISNSVTAWLYTAAASPYSNQVTSLTDGSYAFFAVVTNSLGATAFSDTNTITVAEAPARYVWQDSPEPRPPYADWWTAAHTIQDAVDAAFPGDVILVTNGVYATGGRAVYGLMTNRVALDKPLVLQSVNGPANTWIVGADAPVGGGNGDGAIRCAHVRSNAVLSGFTLTNGHTRTWPNDNFKEVNGGGAWCESGGVVSNCLLVGNSAAGNGGGVYSGALDNCTVTGNSAGYGGGSSGSTLNDCTLTDNSAWDGGGACDSTLNNCILTANSAWDWGGGGAYDCTLNACTLTNNQAYTGGGACDSTLNNCILTGNWATFGGGAGGSALNNCTLTGNSAHLGGGAGNSTLNNCTLNGNSAFGEQGVYSEGGCGGGACDSTLNNCALTGNSASRYGGAFAYVSFLGPGFTLNNCTLTGNSAGCGGGGAVGGTLNNSIVHYNTAPSGPNYNGYGGGCTFNYSCTTPLPTGPGNITNDPAFCDPADGNFRLQSNSPCINAGNNAYVATATDLDGDPRIANGTVDMGAYEWQPAGPPFFGTQPQSLTVAVGWTAIFAAEGRGTWPLFYQWQKDGTNLAGQTNRTLSLPNVQTNDAGLYALLVTNEYGWALSSNASLAVLEMPPAITAQPQGRATVVSAAAKFEVAANGAWPLFYQWRKDGTNPADGRNISGATTAILRLTNVQSNDAGLYSVLVTNRYGWTLSSNAALEVLAPGAALSWSSGFDSGRPAGMTLFGNATVQSGYLKLTTPSMDQYGVAYIADFCSELPIIAFRATFKAMLFGHGSGLPADGFSFNLVPSAGLNPSPGFQEYEEGLASGLAVNFDTYNNAGDGPAIEVKWLGTLIGRVFFQCSPSPDAPNAAAAAKEVVIELALDGKLDITYGTNVIFAQLQTPYTPISGACWVIAARTGACYDNQWFDDVCITAFTPSATPLNVVVPAQVTNGFFVAGFQGTPGLTYSIESMDSLAGSWQWLTNLSVPPDGIIRFQEDTRGVPQRFYRAVSPAR
jgi:hypothetical protein